MNLAKLDQFFKFLDVPAKPLIGVDLSASAIKCVEVSRSRSGELTVENYHIEPTPKDAFTDQEMKVDVLGAALERAWKRLGTKVKTVAMAVPANVAISKRVKAPVEFDELALEEFVREEAKQFIPFEPEDVNLDWVVLGPHASAPETHNEVLICGTRREKILAYQEIAEAAGLQVIKMDIDSYAMQLAFANLQDSFEAYQSEVIAVADAGSAVLNLSIHNKTNGQIFSKEIPCGSSMLTDSICSVYGITPEAANEAKRNNGAGLTDYATQVLEPFLDNLGMEINRALQFFLTQAEVEKIDRILLAGGCAALQGAAEIVGRAAQVETSLFNPFAGMALSSRVKTRDSEHEAPMLVTACGLALRRFDQF